MTKVATTVSARNFGCHTMINLFSVANYLYKSVDAFKQKSIAVYAVSIQVSSH